MTVPPLPPAIPRLPDVTGPQTRAVASGTFTIASFAFASPPLPFAVPALHLNGLSGPK